MTETLPTTLEISAEDVAEFNDIPGKILAYATTAGIVHDVDTDEGDRETRVIRKEGKALAADILKTRRKLNSTLKTAMGQVVKKSDELQQQVIDLYTPHDDAIKAKEAIAKARQEKKRQEKEERARVEAARVAVIQGHLQTIRDMPSKAMALDHTQIQGFITETRQRLKGQLGEFQAEAVTLWATALADTKNLQAVKEEQATTAKAQAEVAAELAAKQAVIDQAAEESRAAAERIRRDEAATTAKKNAELAQREKALAEKERIQRVADEEKAAKADEKKRKALSETQFKAAQIDTLQDMRACGVTAASILGAIISGNIRNVEWTG